MNPAGLQLRRRAPSPERQLEQLRPVGIAYFLRCFGGTLGHADAEDAVANVVLRLHRQIEAGNPPDCLRATFLTSVRNAGIDQLRARARRPTVALEAAAEVPLAEPGPEEAAEREEAGARLREVLARMRASYREVILLRFGAGMSVPEIASHQQITMPAAKKLVMRATAQARQRLEAIEGELFCAEIRDSTRRLLDKRLAGLADETERRLLDAHLAHCGSCRSFLARLRGDLHEIGSGALLLGGTERSGALGRLGEWLTQAGEAAHATAGRARYAALKASGAVPGDAGGAGALAGTAQKVAAVCGAATATTASCLASGLIGPGIGIDASPAGHADRHGSPPPLVRAVDEAPPAEETPPPSAEPAAPESEPEPAAPPQPEAAQQAPEPQPSPAQEASEEFGFESSAPEPEPAPAPTPQPSPPPPSSAGSSSSGSADGESFGFGG